MVRERGCGGGEAGRGRGKGRGKGKRKREGVGQQKAVVRNHSPAIAPTSSPPQPRVHPHARTHVDPRPSTQAPTNKHAETLFLYLIQCLAGKRSLLQNEHDQRLPNFLEPHLASCARNHVPREIHGGGVQRVSYKVRDGVSRPWRGLECESGLKSHMYYKRSVEIVKKVLVSCGSAGLRLICQVIGSVALAAQME